VDEYNSRFATSEELAAIPPVPIKRPRPYANRLFLAVPVGAILIGLIIWQLTRTGASKHTVAPPHTTTTAAVLPAQPVKHVRAALARVLIVATRGRCWLRVRIGSETGPAVYEGTLAQGASVRFVSKRLWIRIGAPWNVDAKLNGRAIGLPARTGNVVVTSTGLSVPG
jgi:hypothetical protein